MRNIRLPISDENRGKLPLPTGDYASDEAALVGCLDASMIPQPPSQVYEFVQWEISPPDDVFAVFELRRAAA